MYLTTLSGLPQETAQKHAFRCAQPNRGVGQGQQDCDTNLPKSKSQSGFLATPETTGVYVRSKPRVPPKEGEPAMRLRPATPLFADA
jgi:hypothetical protein